MNLSTRKSQQQGFSLLESMVTLLVMSMGMVPLAQFQGNLTRGSTLAKQRTEAAGIAQRTLETLRGFEAVSGSAGLNYADISSDSNSPSGNNGTYNQTWTITEHADPGYKSVSVVVNWTDQENNTQSVSLTSNIGRTDPAISGKLYVAQVLVAPPTVADPSYSHHDNVPADAVDQGDGTSIHTDPDSNISTVYVNATGEVVFSHQNLVRITGDIAVEDDVVGNLTVDVTDVVVTSELPSGCYEPGTGYYACYFPSGWSGTIDVGGVNTSQNWVCTNTFQAYNNVVSNQSAENYSVIKKNHDCPSYNPTLHQS